MTESMTVRFTIEKRPLPPAAEVARRLGEAVTAARRAGEGFEIDFVPAAEDEGDALFLIMCEIAKAYPGAVLAE